MEKVRRGGVESLSAGEWDTLVAICHHHEWKALFPDENEEHCQDPPVGARRPCLKCKRDFQPTRSRSRLCAMCFSQATRFEGVAGDFTW